LCFNIHAQDKEGDLQLPVTDISKIQEQEEMPPSIEEVEMTNTPDENKQKTKSKKVRMKKTEKKESK
jgi:hypothetical protein